MSLNLIRTQIIVDDDDDGIDGKVATVCVLRFLSDRFTSNPGVSKQAKEQEERRKKYV